ncbi:MAG TPA: 16S rRNA (guanine(527)-N(7))-methyltransferase RsmG [Nakamurella sp.]|nr:16S rRNA (guanine(527)-N(7))-methyltransferase RsmG [Nakamurella sp.]
MTSGGDFADDTSGSADLESEPLAAQQVFGEGLPAARRYARFLASAGVLRGLIGPREAGRLWSRHLLNCAVLAPLLPAGARVVDIGSGAGLPGVPLAIVRTDCRFDLVEPLERRCLFLNEVVAGLGLPNCRVVRGRAEQVVNGCGAADVVTARAVAPLARLAGWAAPLLRPGGELLALKGSSAATEVQRDAAAMAAAGLTDVEVIEAGAGIVDPATVVVRAVRLVSTPAGRRDRRRRSPGR